VPTSAAGEWRGVLAYSSDVGGSDDIYAVRFDGTAHPAAMRLTDEPEKEFDPDVSPDGSQIAYRRNPSTGSDNADIWVMNVDGTEKRNLTNSPQLSNWAPTWTPDGRIAFSRASAGGVLELWTMNADGSNASRLAPGWCEYAAPSPDGTQFVCAAAVGGVYDIVVVDAATGERQAITNTPRTEFGPSWSRDGAWIAFSRDLGERWELLVAHPDGTGERSVASEGVFSTWEPDNRLAWSGPGGVNVADADGTDRSTLDYPAGFVSWEP
jgi:TolB protein